MNLDKQVKKLRNLPQYKDKTDEELTKIAQEKSDQDEILSSLTFCASPEEEKFAKNLLENYLAQSSFENFSERQTLGQLIDQELLSKRLKVFMKTEYSKDNPSIPLQMVEQLDAVVERIEQLQEKLGLLDKEKKSDNLKELLESLKRKAIKYFEEHQGCNVVKCPYCQNLFYLLLKTEHLTAEKCKWFRGSLLYNKKLLELYKQNKITKEEVAEVLGVEVLYIDKIYEHVYLKEEAENEK